MPFVEIRGSVYFLEYSLLAEFHLDVLGIDIPELFATVFPRLPDGKPDPSPPQKPGRVKAIMTLFAACTANNFVQLHQPIRTAEEWAALIPRVDWVACCKALGETILKAQQAANRTPTQPAVTTGPDGAAIQ